jgi:hypothetical protein
MCASRDRYELHPPVEEPALKDPYRSNEGFVLVDRGPQRPAIMRAPSIPLSWRPRLPPEVPLRLPCYDFPLEDRSIR